MPWLILGGWVGFLALRGWLSRQHGNWPYS